MKFDFELLGEVIHEESLKLKRDKNNDASGKQSSR
jgi:hypothetical protein